MQKRDLVRIILGGQVARAVAAAGRAYAPANLALVKYWGKRDPELNLPVTGSLSVSLGPLGATTEITVHPETDSCTLNGNLLPVDRPFARRLSAYLDLFRTPGLPHFSVVTTNTVPVGAGLASSAAGFAALVVALDQLCGWGLPTRALSILARLGSGSACRSVVPGFVHWHEGRQPDGMDSFAEALPDRWPELRLGVLTVSAAEKLVSSRAGMEACMATAAFYPAWPVKARADLDLVRAALAGHDFAALGQVSESNALAMHAVMLTAWPPLLYWQPETIAAIHRVQALRRAGLAVYLTMDAGPNLVLLFTATTEAAVRAAFPAVQVVVPFPAAPSPGASE